jgi:cell division protease FtsH
VHVIKADQFSKGSRSGRTYDQTASATAGTGGWRTRGTDPTSRERTCGARSERHQAADAAGPPLALLLLGNYLLMRLLLPSPAPAGKVPYTLMKEEVTRHNVEKIYSRRESITGRFRTPVKYPAERDSISGAEPRNVTTFATTLPAFVDPGLEALLMRTMR